MQKQIVGPLGSFILFSKLYSDTVTQFLKTLFILPKLGPDRPAAGALRDPVRHQRLGLQGSAAHDHRPAGHERGGQEGRL